LSALPPRAEGHLDRVQIGGIFGQIAKRRTTGFDGLADTGGFVRRKIVDAAPFHLAITISTNLECGLDTTAMTQVSELSFR
jgi:hypothetical protein